MKASTVKQILLTTAAFCCFTIPALAAPALPSADSNISRIEQNRPLESSTIPIEDGISDSNPSEFGKTRLRVEAFSFSGNEQISVEQFTAVTAEYLGRELTLADLNEACAKVAAYCRDQGYPVTTAYLPRQTIANGIVRINIIIAKTESVEVDNQSHLNEQRAPDFAAFKPGETITKEQLESTALSFGALNGIETSIVLLPGQTEGTSKIRLRLKDTQPIQTAIFTDNSGTKYTGRYRYGFTSTINNVDRMGGMFQVVGIRSNEDMKNYSARYETPFGNRGGKAGFLYARTDYSLSDQFAILGATGVADTISIYGSTPLKQSYSSSIHLNYGYDHKKLKDSMAAFDYETRKESNIFHLGLTGKRTTQTSNTNAALVYYRGDLSLSNAEAQIADTYAHTAGQFHKATLDVNHVQQIAPKLDLALTLHAQAASRNLDSSEQFYLGGLNGVRAYAQSEASGDAGFQSSAELRYQTKVPNLSLIGFVDTGRTRMAKTENEHRNLSGWGLGVQYAAPQDVYARVDYAWKINAKEDQSEGRNKNGRLWFQVYKML